MAQVLIESKFGSLAPIKESVEKQRSGILGRLKGPCAKCDEPTRNGRIYTRKLWENITSCDTFKEYMDNKVLFGELNHPTDRIETDITKVAIALSDIDIQPDGTIIGTFDILDTPNGKILKALCDYGSHPGVSSRGGGDVVTRQGKEYVDESSYDFVAFDVVTLPAVKMARPSVSESVQYNKKVSTLVEDINKVIKSTDNKSDIVSIKSIIETVNMPKKDCILESIDKKLQTLEGENSSNVMRDLTEALNKIDKLEKDNAQLTEKLTAGNSREKALTEKLDKTKSALSRVQGNKCIITDSAKSIAELNKKLKENYEVCAKLRKDLASQTSQLRLVNSELDKTKVKLNANDTELNLVSESKQHIEQKLRISQEKITQLQEQVENYKNNINEQKSNMPILIEEQVQTRTKDYSQQLQRLQESLSTTSAKYNSLVVENKNTRSKLTQLAKQYISYKCKIQGVDESDVYNKLGNKIILEDIDRTIDSLQDFKSRINALPFEVNSGDIIGAKLVTENVQKPVNRYGMEDDLSELKKLMSFKNQK